MGRSSTTTTRTTSTITKTLLLLSFVHYLLICGEALAPSVPPRKPGTSVKPRHATLSTTTMTSSSSSSQRLNVDDLTPNQIERRIVQAGRKGRTDEALHIYRGIERPCVRQVNAAIDACARARPVRLSQAFTLLETSPVPPNVYTYGSLMNACARAGDAERAVSLLRNMTAATTTTENDDDYDGGGYHRVTPNAVVYHAAVSACSNARPPRCDVAWELLDQAHEAGLALSVVGYNAALSAAARAGRVDRAVELLERMERREGNDRDPLIPEPDAVTYGTVLAAFERVEDWNSLMKYAARMQSAGHALDGLAITSILHACQQLGLHREAVHYFELMKQVGPHQRRTAGYQVAGHRKPLQGPDAVAFILAISACARGGAWKDGLRLLEQYKVTGRPDDVAVFTAAVRGCELAGEYQTAFLLVERMRQLGIQPNEMTFAAVMGACANACAKLDGRVEEQQAVLTKALKLLRVLRKDPSTVEPNMQIYNAAIRACAEAHQVDQAFKLVDELSSDEVGVKPNIVTYGTLMAACERVASLDDVNRVFQRMRQDEIEPNQIVYGAAISACRKAGDAERALLLLRKMIRDELEPNIVTFNTVLTAQVEVKGRGPNELDRAMIVFQLLCSKKYSDATPNRQTYNLMVRFLSECQRPREAEVLIRKMRKDHGYIPDVHLYTMVVTAYERSGQPLKALRLMESMNADGYDFYEAKVLNAAFKRALKVANAMGRGFSGVHNDNDIDSSEKEFVYRGENFVSNMQSQVDSERFIQGKRFSVSDDKDESTHWT